MAHSPPKKYNIRRKAKGSIDNHTEARITYLQEELSMIYEVRMATCANSAIALVDSLV